jgi:hypothetical protein
MLVEMGFKVRAILIMGAILTPPLNLTLILTLNLTLILTPTFTIIFTVTLNPKP